MVRASGVVGASTAGSSIAGGFVLVEVASLIRAWRACRSAPLGVGDFRAWLACREMVARRCRPGDGRAMAYSVDELAGLLGVAPKRAGASARRLVAAGLLEWSGSAIALPDAPGPAPGGPIEDSIGGGRGSLAIPRRVVRFLARGARPALIAAVLGVLLRCLSRRRGGFVGRGRLKAAWVAEVFGVATGRVRLARLELAAIGWIAPEGDDQWSMNRWGRAYRIDLGWGRGPADAGPGSIPPRARGGSRTIPPVPDRDLPIGRSRDQEPAPRGPAGVESREGQGGEVPRSPSVPGRPAPPSRPLPAGRDAAGGGPLPTPRLADVRPEDLEETGRALELHRQAVARGWLGDSEADRLRLVSAAEHALAVGEGNPPGLFVHLVRGRLWGHLTQADEDRAHARIKRELRGEPAARAAGPPATRWGGAGPSADAALVREVRATLIRLGHYGDPYPTFASRNPGWTRDRWDRAWEEASGAGRPSARWDTTRGDRSAAVPTIRVGPGIDGTSFAG